MNKNSNTYQILYAAIMVIVVGAALAFVSMTLKSKQELNQANDTRKQILAAIHQVPASDEAIEADFNKYVVRQFLVDSLGNIVDTTQNVAFDVNMKQNVKQQGAARKLPVMQCRLDDGSVKYVIPLYGAGLWGPIWGYVALDADGNTVYGANYSHESETPGLGARIADDSTFHQSFEGKHLYVKGAFKSVAVVKKGQKSPTGGESVDALSGATITSRGVSNMLEGCLKPYDAFLKKLQNATEK